MSVMKRGSLGLSLMNTQAARDGKWAGTALVVNTDKHKMRNQRKHFTQEVSGGSDYTEERSLCLYKQHQSWAVSTT